MTALLGAIVWAACAVIALLAVFAIALRRKIRVFFSDKIKDKRQGDE